MRREHGRARVVPANENGFTLLELMMVVLIIGLLIAVLMPVFLGASTRAKDRATQSSLRDALTAAKIVYTDNQTYKDATTTALSTAAGALTFVDHTTSPSGPSTVSVSAPVSDTYVVFGGRSNSGECFYISDDTTLGTLYAKAPGSGGCSADGAPLPNNAAWQKTW
jgi:type IV pilus assembly protein PilA